MRKFRIVLCALIVTMGLGACGSSTGSTGSETSYVAGDGSTVLIDSKERGPSVALAGTTLDDKTIDISQWRGKVVVVNLWASWCGPCRGEAATLANVSKKLKPEGVEFLGLNTRDGKAAAIAFSDRFDTGYPSIQDQDGTLTLQFGNLGPGATPSTIILDKEGRVASRILGVVTEAQLSGVIDAVLQDS